MERKSQEVAIFSDILKSDWNKIPTYLCNTACLDAQIIGEKHNSRAF